VPPFTEYFPGHFAACHWVEEHGGKAPDIGSGVQATGPVVVEPGSQSGE